MTNAERVRQVQAQERIGFKLVHAVTEWDRRQENKPGFNPYALPQYLEAVSGVVEELDQGKTLPIALGEYFEGRLLAFLLREVTK